ncbi:MAG: FAD-dependent oxidoreductase [Candidatus Brocadiales bacterium]
MGEMRMPPCQQACPSRTNVSKYIRLILEGDLYGAWKVNRATNVFPSICGRVCVHYCEGACKRQNIKPRDGESLSTGPVAIRGLKRFITDHLPPDYAKRFLDETLPIKKNNKAVAVIGSGPAGLTIANDLTLSGCEVVVFEALPEPGGMLRVGIPPYRLPTEVLMDEIDLLRKLGIKIRLNSVLGRDVILEDLRKGFDAVFVAIGAHRPKLMKVKGEHLEGVFPGITFLRRLSLGEAVEVKGKTIAVIGGGFTAADAARSALRLGAKTFILYRRGKEEMPIDDLEQVALLKEDIPTYYLTSPVEIISHDSRKVARLKCVKMELREPEETKSRKDRRRVPVPISGSEFEIRADIVIPAVAQEPDLSIFPENFKINPKDYTTGMEGVFAGGDFLTGTTTDVIKVIGQAHDVSREILKFLGQEHRLPGVPLKLKRIDHAPWYHEDPEKLHREKVYGGWLGIHKRGFQEVEEGMNWELAAYEASRCLQCDFFAEIDKGEACHRCGRCVESCYQGALELVYKELPPGHPGAWFNNGHWQTDETSEVVNNPELCVQCGVCLRACPNQCISFVSYG